MAAMSFSSVSMIARSLCALEGKDVERCQATFVIKRFATTTQRVRRLRRSGKQGGVNGLQKNVRIRRPFHAPRLFVFYVDGARPMTGA